MAGGHLKGHLFPLSPKARTYTYSAATSCLLKLSIMSTPWPSLGNPLQGSALPTFINISLTSEIPQVSLCLMVPLGFSGSTTEDTGM